MLDDRLRVVAMGVVALVWLSLPAAAFAWVYPEHRDIAVGAVRAARSGAQGRVRPALARRAQRARDAPVRAGRRCQARGEAPLHRLGRAVRDRRRSFVLEQGHDRRRPAGGLDPVRRRCRREAQGGSVTDRRAPTAPARPGGQGRDRGYPASNAERDGPGRTVSTRCGARTSGSSAPIPNM